MSKITLAEYRKIAKPGDRIKFYARESIGGHFLNEGIYIETQGETIYFKKDGSYTDFWSENEKQVEIIKLQSKTFMSKVSIMMKKLLDADTQTLVKAGYINGDLDLTDEGTKALQAILFAGVKADLVKMAEDKIAEEKADK